MKVCLTLKKGGYGFNPFRNLLGIRTLKNEKVRLQEPVIRMDNLFDENYEEVPGFGTPGFSVYAGIKASL